MTLFVDILLVIALFSVIASSYQAGLIKTFGGIIGLIVGVVVAGEYFERLAVLIMPIFKNSENMAKIISFFLIFIAVNAVIALLVFVIDSAFDLISFIPFLKTINHLGGAVLGFVLGLFLIGLLIIMVDKFPFADFIRPYLENSRLVPVFTKIAQFVLPLLPEVIKKAKGVLESY